MKKQRMHCSSNCSCTNSHISLYVRTREMGWHCLTTFSYSLIFEWHTVLYKQGPWPGGPRRNLCHMNRGALTFHWERRGTMQACWFECHGSYDDEGNVCEVWDWPCPAGSGAAVPGQHHLLWHTVVRLLTLNLSWICLTTVIMKLWSTDFWKSTIFNGALLG